MSKHDKWAFRIRHILEAIERIEEYTADLGLENFVANRMIRDAVERNFEIIGEASGKVPRSVREEYPDIPWEKMKSLRNFIIHQYDEVEEVAVWNTVQRDLPDLKQQLLTIKLPK